MTFLLTVRGRDDFHQWEVDEWTVLVALAALSAEPETTGELADAMRRYLPNLRLLDTSRQVSCLEEAVSADSPWCLVDFCSHTVIGGGDFDLPERHGAYQVEDGEEVDGFPVIWMDTPKDWEFCEAEEDWQRTIAERTVELPRLDSRRFLFGQPLLEYLAEEVLGSVDRYRRADEEGRWELTSKIHARWLTTERDELGGRTPRQLLLADRERILYDLEHRAQQWSKQGYAPVALSTESFAYRFGGFGTTEVVLYFDLVRALLAEAWQLACDGRAGSKKNLIERLQEYRDRWMSSPYSGGGKETPADLIESERRRMPITADGSHLDCDCPICQAEASGELGFGPAFMWFDGHHLELEDDFAFSLHDDRDIWEMGKEEDRQIAEEVAASRAKRSAAEAGASVFDSSWQSSFVDWERATAPDAPEGLGKLGIGFHLAELVSDLKQRTSDRTYVEALNKAYRSFHTAQSVMVTRSAAERLRDLLEAMAEDYPELVTKSADLQSHLDEVLRHNGANEPRP